MKLQKIQLTSGESINVADGLTAIVGPNNVGKSLLLRELHARLMAERETTLNSSRKIAQGYEIDFCGSVDNFLLALRLRYIERSPGQYPGGTYAEQTFQLPNGSVLHHSQIHRGWESQTGLGALGQYFVLYLGAEGRLGMAGNAASFNPLMQQPSTPVQLIYADRALADKVSDLMGRAFNQSLSVNRYGGSEITLHVGKVETEETKPPISKKYIQELSLLPQLQEQGDGIRAFVGMLLTIITAQYPLVIIDEPEAFLHPPQAYLLGRVLAEQHDEGTQVLIATHSEDIIAGITSVKAITDNVSIVRLTRKGTANHAAQVPPATVGALYKDPLVKYYSILNGLFFQGVILCEGDSDCTYYRAVLESIDTLDDGTKASATSVHFTHCGGKARLSRAVGALRSAKVPVVCAVDIDFLQNEHEFNELITAYEGDPSKLTGLRSVVVNAVTAWSTTVKRASAKAEIDAILSRKQAEELSSGDVNKIRELVTPVSGWKELKKYGQSRLLGDALIAFRSLDSQLRNLGIYLVQGGELESFHPEISRDDKAAWLRQVLEDKKYETCEESTLFVKDMAAAIVTAQ